MDRAEEEAVLRITAQYVAEMGTGRAPKLSDYLTRYPQYADEIANFVAYYHAVEVEIPEELDVMPYPSQELRIAIDYAWQRVLQSESTHAKQSQTLLMLAKGRRLSLPQLATEMNLSGDIVTKLDSRTMNAVSIPGEVFNRLAQALAQPLRVILDYFGLVGRQQVAESPLVYHMQQELDAHTSSFREVVEASEQLTVEQKASWQTILDREGL